MDVNNCESRATNVHIENEDSEENIDKNHTDDEEYNHVCKKCNSEDNFKCFCNEIVEHEYTLHKKFET